MTKFQLKAAKIDKVMELVIPMSSIEYLGTRRFDQINEYSKIRVFGSSIRAFRFTVFHPKFHNDFLRKAF